MTPVRLRAWNLIASLVFVLLAAACDSSDPDRAEIPEEIIPQDSMAGILTDVHIVEGAKVGRSIIGNDSLEVKHFYDKVFSKHGVTKERFEKSFEFYTERPGKMQEIYEKVIENLNKIDLHPKRESLEEEADEKDKATEDEGSAEPQDELQSGN